MRVIGKAALGGFGVAVLFGSSALAQNQDVVEEVIVTATKMQSTIQNTPVAVTVIGGDMLADKGIIDVNDLPNVAPGLEVGFTNLGPVINIRGVSTTDNASKGGQGIGFIVDGISVGRPIERATALFDIDRIEVLRGPQGTLYGKSTTGGVISVVTRRPGEEFGGNIDIEYGNFNTVRANAGLDLPVADKIKLRLALNSNQSEGWLDLDLGD
jgi:iron complex outermembrane receptor protein